MDGMEARFAIAAARERALKQLSRAMDEKLKWMEEAPPESLSSLDFRHLDDMYHLRNEARAAIDSVTCATQRIVSEMAEGAQ